MKQNAILIMILFFVTIQFVYSGSVDKITSSYSKYKNEEYINFFKIPLSAMTTLFANGDSKSTDNQLWYAFDGNEETYWKSKAINGETFVNPTNGVQYTSIKNSISITFSKKVQINRILYKFEKSSHDFSAGYPLQLKIYYKTKGSTGYMSNKDSDFIYFDVFKSLKSDLVVFNLKSTLTCDAIKLEFVDNGSSNSIACDISLLMPENSLVNESILKVFTQSDYREFSLSTEYKNVAKVAKLREAAKNITNINPYANSFLNKAYSLAGGSTYTPNTKREFTTDPTAKVNIIKQEGDVAKYASQNLKMIWFGTNRQVTGIYGKSNEAITVYVSAGENDPLPSIVFTQFMASWKDWRSNEIKLKRGKNYLTFNSFNTSSYSRNVNPGGPIYIVNPYTSDSQSSRVKVYIEGGEIFPIFRLNEDENEYKALLIGFVRQNNYLDITELVGKRVIMTVRGFDAYNIYRQKGKGPQQNLQKWDKYVTSLLKFDGVQFSTSEQYYNKLNNYLNINIRHTQPYGLAYAYSEHVGIFEQDWIDKAIDAVEGDYGWGYTHEIGHMMDNLDRKVSETTNNMISKWLVVTKEKDSTWGDDHYEEKLKALTLDSTDVKLRGCKESDTSKCNGFFKNWPLNYLIFWDLESYKHGYWGKLDNLYRYDFKTTEGMSKTERFVFFSSQIMGIDLGYYFQRWGFYLNNEDLFDTTKTSTKYNQLMQTYQKSGIINNSVKKKFWYLNQGEYNYVSQTNKDCYGNRAAYTISIRNIVIGSGFMTININSVSCGGHLGFEVYANNKLIGFTYTNSFKDTNKYTKGTKVYYKVIAYDKLLYSSASSANMAVTAS